MGAVFTGFATIGIIIGLGILLAHVGVIERSGQLTLSTLAFYVAGPALLFTVLRSSDIGRVFSGNLVAIAGAVVVTAVVTISFAAARHAEVGYTAVAAMCSSYCNAGNLGLPIAAYVLGDAALVAPVLLLQVIVLQPIALTVLDVVVSPARRSVARMLLRPLANPITIGTMAGVLVALLDLRVPAVVSDPIALVGAMAVPSMLLAYGVSLRLGPLPGRGVPVNLLAEAVALKLVFQPLLAYLIGRAIGLNSASLLAVTVLSALPTAQNVFVIATRYGRGVALARDAILVSTIACVPAIIVIVGLLA
jgi:malonate transporter and related proteins